MGADSSRYLGNHGLVWGWCFFWVFFLHDFCHKCLITQLHANIPKMVTVGTGKAWNGDNDKRNWRITHSHPRLRVISWVALELGWEVKTRETEVKKDWRQRCQSIPVENEMSQSVFLAQFYWCASAPVFTLIWPERDEHKQCISSALSDKSVAILKPNRFNGLVRY